MNKIKKIITSLITTASLLLGLCTFNISAANNKEIVVKTFSVNESGMVEVYGYIENCSLDEAQWATLLLIKGTRDDLNTLDDGDIVYIDQIELGNNCSFLFKFPLTTKFSTDESLNADFTLCVGSDVSVNTYFETINISNREFSLRHIANNDVIYGLDVYSLSAGSSYLTGENVANSIIYGGNQIYYKLGNLYYDLLDKKATSSSYLVEANAIDDAIIENLNLRYYYKGQFELNFIK